MTSPDLRSGPDRRMVLASGSAALLTSALPLHADAAASPVVKTTAGPVRGVSDGRVNRFLGIPYAQPISGANRFAPPRPVAPWTEPFVADRHADTAPQGPEPVDGSPVTPAFAPPDYVKAGDACLALNVWAPAGADGQLPVMVWLHGGGWQSGSGSCAIYDGTRLAGRGDVVIVTINHRLGAHGLTDFSRVLGGSFADSANLSVKDMIAALEWVRDNIANFGGNPQLVTIFGESGGGWKVNTLLGTPAAAGLFHRAIVESGPLTRFASPEQADEIARSLLRHLAIPPEHPERLHALSAEQVLAAERAVMADHPMSFTAPGFPSGFWPVLDGTLIARHVYDPDTAAAGSAVPLLLGQTATEFTLFMLRDKDAYSLDDAALEARVIRAFGDENAAVLLASYRRDFPQDTPSSLWFRLFSDYAMGTLSTEILNIRATTAEAPVYAYRFDWMTPIADGKLHSPHTIEIPFVFDNVTTPAGRIMTGHGPGDGPGGGPGTDALAASVSEAWVQFAKTGKPAAAGLPEWPRYDMATRHAMHLNVESHVAPYMDEKVAGLFRDLLWARAGLD